VNLKSVWLLSQAAGQHMVPRRKGKIVNFCSLLTFQGGLTVPAYAAAKGALGQLTKALSNEWSQHNVQVNGICPGYIATDMYVPYFPLSLFVGVCVCTRRFARRQSLPTERGALSSSRRLLTVLRARGHAWTHIDRIVPND
jgi:NAD(P)-dependent dehydrogenase (short-subunit alcohol dehydrogenase family)